MGKAQQIKDTEGFGHGGFEYHPHAPARTGHATGTYGQFPPVSAEFHAGFATPYGG